MAAEIKVGQLVELTAVENSELDLVGRRGIVVAMRPGSGLATVRVDDGRGRPGAEIRARAENLKVVAPAPAAE